MSATTNTGVVWQDAGASILARVYGHDGQPLLQTSISSLSRTVTEITDPTAPATIAGPTLLTLADVWYDTLQTDGRWKEDETGYNFLDPLPASVLPKRGQDAAYRVEYLLTPTSGEKFRFVFELLAKQIFG